MVVEQPQQLMLMLLLHADPASTGTVGVLRKIARTCTACSQLSCFVYTAKEPERKLQTNVFTILPCTQQLDLRPEAVLHLALGVLRARSLESSN
jgi:hypothetical protein